MTCIVGLEAEGRVYIGGDSAGADSGWEINTRDDEKVFRLGPFVMGFTTSFRFGQLLRYSFQTPERVGRQTDMAYMVTTFVDEVRRCLKDGGILKSESGVESGGTFLVGYLGTLYAIHDDLQVARNSVGYAAVGSGASIALGAMYATPHLAPVARIRGALAASAEFNAAVRPPFRVRHR